MAAETNQTPTSAVTKSIRMDSGSPFISMYLLEHVGMTIDRVLLLWALSWVGGAMLSRRFGHIAENYGHRPLLILCTMLKALNMGAMLVTPRDPDLAFWLLVPILAMDAQLNAGINIANQGYMLKYSPRENRTTFLAAGTALDDQTLKLIAALIADPAQSQFEQLVLRVGLDLNVAAPFAQELAAGRGRLADEFGRRHRRRIVVPAGDHQRLLVSGK